VERYNVQYLHCIILKSGKNVLCFNETMVGFGFSAVRNDANFATTVHSYSTAGQVSPGADPDFGTLTKSNIIFV
jgi:hypothetical protein